MATKELRAVLLADPGIGAALELARQASTFMAAVGKVVERSATILQTGLLDYLIIEDRTLAEVEKADPARGLIVACDADTPTRRLDPYLAVFDLALPAR